MATSSESKNSQVNFKAGKHFTMPGYYNYMKTTFAAVDKPGTLYDLILWACMGGNGIKAIAQKMQNKSMAECQKEIDKFVAHMDTIPQEFKDFIIKDFELND
jgi:hypothetical protein